jgi:hypothetical protein
MLFGTRLLTLCTLFLCLSVSVTVADGDDGRWCVDQPVRLNSREGFDMQHIQHGPYAYVVFLVASVRSEYRDTIKIVREVAKKIVDLGLATVIVDEEGSEEEQRVVGRYGEGPIPRVLLFHDRPKGFHSRPMLLTTEPDELGADRIVELIERKAGNLEADDASEPGCPPRLVKQGVVHLSSEPLARRSVDEL